MSTRLVLGTAGHIDHGKTALVRELTGVDTDRLKEEKERGITVDLGFAELPVDEELGFGVVDVPGHEGFIRNMVAGATGVDVVLFVVAADEGVMPQTREHLDIVRHLGLRRMVVALTKADLVEEGWLELVREEVQELLGEHGFEDVTAVATSTVTGEGIGELRAALAAVGRMGGRRSHADVPRLPVDRVFTVRGTGTVVTGTLWSGSLEVDERVKVLPDGPEARIRGLQLHGREAGRVRAGQRVAAALAGADVDHRALKRGQTLVRGEGWEASWMITVHLAVSSTPGWPVEHGQRVRVHLGTAEVMARAAVLEGASIPPGGEGWVQLRLEAPLVARAGDRLIVRSYSPMTTIAGGVVVEPVSPKRTGLSDAERGALERIVLGGPAEVVAGVLELAGLRGVGRDALPVLTGLDSEGVEEGVARLAPELLEGTGRLFRPDVASRGREALMAAVDGHHAAHPLEPGIPLELLRQALSDPPGPAVAAALMESLAREGALEIRGGHASRPEFRPTLTEGQEEAARRLTDLYREASLAPPVVDDLPVELRQREDLPALLDYLVRDGRLTVLDERFHVWTEALAEAEERVRTVLGGREDLGPTDFREAFTVSRRHLIPLLNHLDARGITVRRGGGREVVSGRPGSQEAPPKEC